MVLWPEKKNGLGYVRELLALLFYNLKGEWWFKKDLRGMKKRSYTKGKKRHEGYK